jgi:hypothetical protein
VRQCKEREERMNEDEWSEDSNRKNNILIFRLEEKRGKSYFNTLEVTKKFLRKATK